MQDAQQLMFQYTISDTTTAQVSLTSSVTGNQQKKKFNFTVNLSSKINYLFCSGSDCMPHPTLSRTDLCTTQTVVRSSEQENSFKCQIELQLSVHNFALLSSRNFASSQGNIWIINSIEMNCIQKALVIVRRICTFSKTMIAII